MEQDFDTRCLHLDEDEERRELRQSFGSLSTPIYQTATFAHIGGSDYEYTRESNPTRSHLEKMVARLENGCDCLALSSGMAAITLVLSLLQPGDTLLVDSDLYGGSIRLFDLAAARTGIRVVRQQLARDYSVADGTRAVYLETPTNPMMHVTDLARIAKNAHKAGALLIVDNTFLSPCFQNPIDFGADLVLHSGTKFLAGHHDVLAGFVVAGSTLLARDLRRLAVATGACLGPQDSWLVIRGIKTLSLRMEREQENALAIAQWLKTQPAVTRVLYPGLPEHPGYEIMQRQTRGAGAVLTFEMESAAAAQAVLRHIHLIKFAESLGGTETLMTYPITQTHAEVPEEIRRENGLNDRILRLSVGIESKRDLLKDLARAWKESEEERICRNAI